jgi:glycosyltransferase involved in cell wall biosynthesis
MEVSIESFVYALMNGGDDSFVLTKRKIGVVVCTHNRPEYLKQCLASLMSSHLSKVEQVVIVDDCSDDERTIKLIQNSEIVNNKFFAMSLQQKGNISTSLLKGYEYFFSKDYDLVINLDGDAIVNPDFINRIVELKLNFPKNIVTGFNCTTKNVDGTERHPIVSEAQIHNRKSHIGGINMCIDKYDYEKYMKPILEHAKDVVGANWDNNLCDKMKAEGKYFISCVPSVVQHIGIDSSMGHNDNPDVADDFE